MEHVETTTFIKRRASELEAAIIDTRRYLHQHPEFSAHEVETSEYICEKLSQLGIEYTRVQGKRPEAFSQERTDFVGTGIIATIRGEAPGAYGEDGKPAKRIAMRADIDALPIRERTGAEYQSESEGGMHACGPA